MKRKKKTKKIKKKIKKNKIKKTRSKFIKSQPSGQTNYKSKIFKSNEIKIKKITKQPTEKKIYNIKDYVVYPKHGSWKNNFYR